jgi:hypothetical protein
MKKRILVLLSVVAMMVGMMAMSVAPAAFAHGAFCTGKGILTGTTPGANGDKDGDGWICFQPNRGVYKDDHGLGGH